MLRWYRCIPTKLPPKQEYWCVENRNMICLDLVLKAFSSFNSIVYILPKKLNKNRFTWINDLNIKIYNLKEKTRNTHICRMMETFIWCSILSIFAICAWGLPMNYVWKHLKIKKMLKCLLMTTTQNPKEKSIIAQHIQHKVSIHAWSWWGFFIHGIKVSIMVVANRCITASMATVCYLRTVGFLPQVLRCIMKDL